MNKGFKGVRGKAIIVGWDDNDQIRKMWQDAMPKSLFFKTEDFIPVPVKPWSDIKTNKTMIDKVKQLRVNIDGLSQLVKDLKPCSVYGVGKVPARHFGNHDTEIGYTEKLDNSKEIEKAYDSLILAKAWLGKVLQELGEESPYPKDGTRKTIKDIEPTADVKSIGKADDNDIYHDATHIEKVDYIRQEIQKIELAPDHPHGEWHIWSYAWNKSRECLIEARFWLGFELGRIREEES